MHRTLVPLTALALTAVLAGAAWSAPVDAVLSFSNGVAALSLGGERYRFTTT